MAAWQYRMSIEENSRVADVFSRLKSASSAVEICKPALNNHDGHN
jgi:hypothetical protein